MEEFSDDFLKKLFEQKSEEYNPQESLQQEWNYIDNAINTKPAIWVKSLLVASIALLFSVPFTLNDINIKNGFYHKDSSENENSNLNIKKVDNEINSPKESIDVNRQIELAINNNNTVQKSVINIDHRISASVVDKKQRHTLGNKRIHTYTLSSKQPLPYQQLVGEQVLQRKFEAILINKREIVLNDNQQKWALLAGGYYNFGRYSANKNDDVRINSFNQSNNIFQNRLGLQFSIEYSGYQTFLGRIKPSFSYGILNKSFSYNRDNIENTNSVSVNITSHFLTLGGKIITKGNSIIGLHLQRNILQPKSKDNIVFSKNIFLFEVGKELAIKTGQKPIIFRPYVQYGVPLNKGLTTYDTFPINIGVLIRIR